MRENGLFSTRLRAAAGFSSRTNAKNQHQMAFSASVKHVKNGAVMFT